MLGPLAICRLDSDLVERIRTRNGLAAIVGATSFWLVLGAAAYGFVFGSWRAPLQAGYAALKLPLLLSSIALATTLANTVFAKLLRTDLDARQSLVCALLSMSMLAIVLASLAPVVLLLTASLESYGETLVDQSSRSAALGLRYSHALLAAHVAIIAVAGVAVLQRLRELLAALVESRSAAVGLFWLWLGIQALAGTQLSWILRPYLGKPTLRVELLRPDALRGSFFEEVARWLGA